MLKKYLKILVVLFAFVFAFSMAANAGTGSDTSMKGMALDNNTAFMVDGQMGYLVTNPAAQGQFKNRLFFEAEPSTSTYSGDLILGLGEHGSLSAIKGVPVDVAAPGQIWSATGFGMKNVSAATNPYYAKKTTSGALTNGGSQNTSPYLASTAFNLVDQTYGGDAMAALDKIDFGFILAYDFGPVSLGLVFQLASALDSTKTEYTQSASIDRDFKEKVGFHNNQIQFGLGAIFKVTDAFKIGVNGAYAIYGIDNKYKASQTLTALAGTTLGTTEIAYKTDGAGDLKFGVDFAFAMNEKAKLHLSIQDSIVNHSTKGTQKVTDVAGTVTTDLEDTYSRKGNLLDVGISQEINVTKDIMVFTGFMLENTMGKLKFNGHDNLATATDPYISSPYNAKLNGLEFFALVGGEAKLSENWSGRLGVKHMIYDKPAEDNATGTVERSNTTPDHTQFAANKSTKASEKGATTTVAMGLSYQMGYVTVDWLGNVDLFVYGPSVISGRSTNGDSGIDWSTKIAATLNFDSLISGKK